MVLAMTATLLIHGDARHLPLRAASVDAIVTDPPYGLGFMGKAWDHGVPGVPFWVEALRVLKPGGHLLAFGGTRTFHRQAVAIEDAGFEVRDCLSWLYGSGFPKSLDVSKAIDKAAGAEREDVYEDRPRVMDNQVFGKGLGVGVVERRPATDEAAEWDGWGTALKPAWEPVLMARKPLAGTVAANVLAHGTGALNVDGCRIAATGRPLIESASEPSLNAYGDGLNGSRHAGSTDLGRWPANVALDETAAAILDTQTGNLPPATPRGDLALERDDVYADSGGASRFFYVAKPSKAERNAGMGHLAERETIRYGEQGQGPRPQQTPRAAVSQANHHPTVKPVALMRWLVRMVTPPGGVVLDPFMGSGTTLEAATLEGFHGIGVELTAEYLPLAQGRTARPLQPGLFA